MAAIPNGSASAANATKPAVEIPAGDLGSILPSLPISDLGLTDTELGQLLSGIGGLGGSSNQLTTLVSGLLDSNPTATIGDLVNGLLGDTPLAGLLGGGLKPEQIIEKLNPTELSTLLDNITVNLNSEQLSKLLSGLAGKLNSEQLGSLQSIIGALTGALSPTQLVKVQEVLTTVLSDLSHGELAPALQALKGLLSGAGLNELEGLLGNLGSLSGTELTTRLEELLKGLNTTQLSSLLGILFGRLPSSQLEPLFGDLLGGLPLSATNAGSLANELGTTVDGLGEQVGPGVESTTPALSAVLGEEGPVLSVLDGRGGLKLGLLEAGKGGNGGSGGESGNTTQGSGSNGGTGGGAGNSPGQNETINVTLPGSQTTTAPAKAATKAAAKIKIISHKVKGKVATIVVQIPGAGKITLSGAHVSKASRTAGKSGRFTLKVKLTKAGSASLNRHKSFLRVVLKAAYKPKSGANSSATTLVRFV